MSSFFNFFNRPVVQLVFKPATLLLCYFLMQYNSKLLCLFFIFYLFFRFHHKQLSDIYYVITSICDTKEVINSEEVINSKEEGTEEYTWSEISIASFVERGIIDSSTVEYIKYYVPSFDLDAPLSYLDYQILIHKLREAIERGPASLMNPTLIDIIVDHIQSVLLSGYDPSNSLQILSELSFLEEVDEYICNTVENIREYSITSEKNQTNL